MRVTRKTHAPPPTLPPSLCSTPPHTPASHPQCTLSEYKHRWLDLERTPSVYLVSCILKSKMIRQPVTSS